MEKKNYNLTLTFKSNKELKSVITKLNKIDMNKTNSMRTNTARAVMNAIKSYIETK